VTAGRDDDALTWDGDDDPTLDVGAKPVTDAEGSVASPAPVLPDGYTAVGKGSEQLASPSTAAPADGLDQPVAGQPRAAMGNAALISLGVIGGVFLLYTLGWIVGGLRLQGTAQFLVSPVIYQVALWLAILAPLVWFGTTFLLTRGSKAWVRFAWLIGGVALLIPWPFIMTGAVGQ
jgi:hypothetical protein